MFKDCNYRRSNKIEKRLRLKKGNKKDIDFLMLSSNNWQKTNKNSETMKARYMWQQQCHEINQAQVSFL